VRKPDGLVTRRTIPARSGDAAARAPRAAGRALSALLSTAGV
jgi:hypothetical protein